MLSHEAARSLPAWEESVIALRLPTVDHKVEPPHLAHPTRPNVVALPPVLHPPTPTPSQKLVETELHLYRKSKRSSATVFHPAKPQRRSDHADPVSPTISTLPPRNVASKRHPRNRTNWPPTFEGPWPSTLVPVIEEAPVLHRQSKVHLVRRLCIRICMSRRTRARASREAHPSAFSVLVKRGANRERRSRAGRRASPVIWCKSTKRGKGDVEAHMIDHRCNRPALPEALLSHPARKQRMDGRWNPYKTDSSYKRESTALSLLSLFPATLHPTNDLPLAGFDTSSKRPPSVQVVPNPTSSAGVTCIPWSILQPIVDPRHLPCCTTISTQLSVLSRLHALPTIFRLVVSSTSTSTHLRHPKISLSTWFVSRSRPLSS